MKKSLPITYEDAFTKYFGKITEIKVYPFQCKCGAQFLHINDTIWVHIRIAHKERVVSKGYLATLEQRRRETGEGL